MTPREELEMLRAQQGPLEGLAPQAPGMPTPPPGVTPINPGARTPLPPMNVDPTEGMDEMDKLIVGWGHNVDKTLRGLSRILPQGSEGYRKRGKEAEEAYERHHPGGWATVGDIGADVLNSAIPVAKGGQLLSQGLGFLAKHAGKVPVLGKALGLLPSAGAVGDIAANAAYAGATSPENSGDAALKGGAGAAAGRALPATVARLGRPVKTSPITEMMLEEGIPLTPGQAGGSLARAFEGSLYNTPFMPGIRRSVGNAQKLGQEASEDFLTDAGRLANNPAAYGLTDTQAEQWLKGAENINDVNTSTVPIQALAALFHIKTGGSSFVALSGLYGTDIGRAFLTGQLPYQELIRRAPQLAPYAQQVMRAAATTDGAPTQE